MGRARRRYRRSRLPNPSEAAGPLCPAGTDPSRPPSLDAERSGCLALVEPISTRRRTRFVSNGQFERRAETALALAAVAAAFVSFHRWGLGAVMATALVAGLVGMRQRLPLPLVLAASAAAGSALIHFAVAPEHFAEWWGLGLFFVVCGQVQIGWALLLGRLRGRRMLAVGATGSVFLLVLWALSRTAGLPFGPDPGLPEPVSLPDLVSVLLELVTVAACMWALVAPARLQKGAGFSARLLVPVAAIGLTALALAAVGAA